MNISAIIVTVILPFPIRKSFKYIMPSYMKPIIGARIIVPFRSKDIIGIIFSFSNQYNINQLLFKTVKSVIDHTSIYNRFVFNLLAWLSQYYHCPIGNVFFSILPKYLRIGKKVNEIYLYQWKLILKKLKIDLKRFQNRKAILEILALLNTKTILNYELNHSMISHSILKKLSIKKSCINKYTIEKNFNKKYVLMKKKILLNQNIISNIEMILKKTCFSSWLVTNINLYTRIKFYLGLIKKILDQGLQILILVPCVKYIYKMTHFLNIYFDVSISIFHSKISDAKYLQNWIQSKNGINNIIIGTNMSIFFPFLKLGLIIINEENSIFYYHKSTCRYNIRDISIFRAFKENIPIILDSDTPSLKTLYNIFLKKCFYVHLKKNISIKKIQNTIINLKKEKMILGLSFSLLAEIKKTIKNKKQVLLIFNRLNFIFLGLMCNNCGWIAKCNNCNNYYEIHQYYQMLICKLCLIKINKPFFCFNCGFFSLIVFDFGIKTIKSKIKNIFLKTKVIFLLHTTKKKSYLIDSKLSYSSECIIVTIKQIVQKYFFPNVNLIGLINIDAYFIDFNFLAIEDLTQFYMNLKGLTSNHNQLLKIFIQTSFSKNMDLIKLCEKNYFFLAKTMLQHRRNYLLPPWSFQIVIYVESMSFKDNSIFLDYLSNILKNISQKDRISLFFLGPHPILFLNYKKKPCSQLLIQCISRPYLNNLFKESISIMNCFSISKKITWFIDIT